MKKVKEVLVCALVLTLVAGCVTAALAGTNALTADIIAARIAQTENAARLQVMEADRFEQHTQTADDGEFVYHTAVKDGLTVGYVFVTQAVGKSSGLTVMTGISARGVITGVVVTADNETAGYVDRVEKAGFFQQFTGKEVPLLDVNGDIDTVSQATKTSKGIAAAVDTAIERYYIVVKEEQE